MANGPYWDHVKGYRKVSLEHPENVFFLTYEEMSVDIVDVVKRLANFLGYPFTEKEEAEGTVNEIVKLCGFKNLSEVNKHGLNNVFFREGKVGDWKNYLTDEMSRTLDEITEEKFKGLDISFPI
ncbi:putative flavonol 3-sulfotransferase [Helianthus debilis subsp. tardiflorus]